MSERTESTDQELDPTVGPVAAVPPWASRGVKKFHSLSDVRAEQTAIYWLWRKHGRLTVGHMTAAIQSLRVIGSVLEAERQVEVEKLREEVRDLRAELERQESLRVISPSVSWPALPSSAQN